MKLPRTSLLLLFPALLATSCEDSGEFAPGYSPALERSAVAAGVEGAFAGEFFKDTRIDPILPSLYLAPSEDCPIIPVYYACYTDNSTGAESWFDAARGAHASSQLLRNDAAKAGRLLQAYEAKASSGNMAATLNAAGLLHEGLGAAKNDARAMEYLRKAAVDGSPALLPARFGIRFLQLQGGNLNLAECLREIEADATANKEVKNALELGEQLHLIGTTRATDDAARKQVLATLTAIADKDKTGSAHYAAALNHRHGLMGVAANNAEALAHYQKAANPANKHGGYARAELALGHIYQFGLLGQGKDRQKAVEYYTRAAGQKDGPTATMHRARTALAVDSLLHGGKTEQKPAEALRAAAEFGDRAAAYNHAMLSLAQAGGKLSADLLTQIAKAAEGGQADIQAAARIYRALQDKEQAGTVSEADLALLRNSATPAAKTLLANCYATGTGVARDMKEAARLYGENAEKDPAARHNLALCCEKGSGCEANQSRAAELKARAAEELRAAASLGTAGALALGSAPTESCRLIVVVPPPPPAELKLLSPAHYLAPSIEITLNSSYTVCYSDCDLGSVNWYDHKKPFFENIRFLKKLAQQNSPRLKTILQAYEAKARRGDVNAMINAGAFYYRGYGTSEDNEKAMEYFRMAAKPGSSVEHIARQNICCLQEASDKYTLVNSLNEVEAESRKGDGDYEFGELICTLNRAKAHGAEDHRLSRLVLERITPRDKTGASHYVHALNKRFGEMGDTVNEKEAFRYYREAASESFKCKGYPNAKLALGNIYRFGLLGQPQNKQKALHYYSLAAVMHNNLGSQAVPHRARTALAVDQILKGSPRATLNIQPEPATGRVDRVRALQALEQAAEYEDELACYNLGMYRLIQAQCEMKNNILNLITTATACGQADIEAFARIYQALHSKTNEVTDADIALLKADGSPAAQTLLANCYAMGVGVGSDMAEATRLYRENADKCPAARHNLGRCHEYGLGVPLDTKKAAELKAQAAAELRKARH